MSAEAGAVLLAEDRGTRVRADLGLLPALTLVIAVGFGLIVAGYDASRTGGAHADLLYWAGQVLIFVPAIGRVVLSRGIRAGEAAGLVIVVALVQYLVKYAYSPLGFTFPDELAHWRSAADLIQTGHLFTANDMLPISPQFPGLELLTAAISSLGGTSIFTAGTLVAGGAHLVAIAALFILLRGATGSPRVAALGGLIYQTNPHYQFFDSFFIYQTVAFALLVVVLVLAAKDEPQSALWSGTATRPHRPHLVLATAAIAAVVVTHHVTAFALVAFLLGLFAFDLWWSRRGTSLPLLAAAVVALGLWMGLAARSTVSYLSPAASDLVSGATGLLGHSTQKTISGAAPAVPVVDRLLTYGATALMVVLISLGVAVIWRRHRTTRMLVFLGLASLTYFGVLVLRVVSADGAELAGRAFTFSYIPASVVAAMGVMALLDRRPQRAVAVAVLAGMTLLFVGGLAGGWPPWWERLPGGYQVSGIERSLSQPDRAVAAWMLPNLGSHNRVAVDLADYGLVGGYGDQDVIRNGRALYVSDRFSAADAAFVKDASIRYVVIDRRLSTALPASGRYFPDDPFENRYVRPLSATALGKFDGIAGVQRVYDNGPIQVYDLADSEYTR